MSKASPAKRIRLTEKKISSVKGDKRLRNEAKLAYLKTLPSSARFEAGKKQLGEGGWK